MLKVRLEYSNLKQFNLHSFNESAYLFMKTLFQLFSFPQIMDEPHFAWM